MSQIDPFNIKINQPSLWSARYPLIKPEGHKYHRGHCVVVSGGPACTGAARLAAGAALRAGAGLVTLFSPPNALLVNAAHLTAVMVKSINGVEALERALESKKISAIVAGPALGVSENSCLMVETILSSGKNVVLDADALTSFNDDPARLFAAIKSTKKPVVITPHMGEYCALFGGSFDADHAERLERVRHAAKLSGAIVVLKGAGTLVASADGMAVSRCDTAPPWLATAGSGDVLAGIVGGLLAQNMPAFEAASCAVWLHGEAANHCGPALIAEDLDSGLKVAITKLHKN